MRMGSRDWRQKASAPVVALVNLVRHMAVRTAAAAAWRLAGYEDGDGNEELEDGEVFSGIGFWSLPSASGEAEVILAHPGAATGNSAVIATRDEKTRAAVVAALGGVDAGEHGATLTFNGGAVVWLRGDGGVEIRCAPGKTVEIKSWDGAAAELMTKADGQVLRSALTTAAISVGAGGAATVVTACDAAVTPATWPVGTKVLKGE
jgi:phage gp45-like